MCTLLAKWDWFLLFILLWNMEPSSFVGAKRRDILCIITYYIRVLRTPYCLYISSNFCITALFPPVHWVYRRPRLVTLTIYSIDELNILYSSCNQ